MTSSDGNICRVTGHLCGEFTDHRWIPLTKASDAELDLRLNKRLGKQPWGWWFETPSCQLWRHCNGFVVNDYFYHSWGDSLMIITHDCVTRENEWQIPPLWKNKQQKNNYYSHKPCSMLCITASITVIPRQNETKQDHMRIVWVKLHTLQWRHNGRDGVSNHQPHDCLFNRSFRRRSKKISNLCVTGLCEGNSSVTGEFPAQRANNAENVSISWRLHEPPYQSPGEP